MSRVSIVIPAHNAAQYLANAIASAQAQTHDAVEIVVVNDGSTDATREILDSYGNVVVAIHQPNLGASAARNAGVTASSGEYVCFLDADDCIRPDAVASQAQFLDTHSEFDLVAGGLDVINESGRLIDTQQPWIHHPVITIEWLTLGGLSGPTGVLLRRSLFNNIGGFDTGLTHVEDVDLWWRLMRAGCRMSWIPRIVGSYRIHQTSLSQDLLFHHEKRVALLDQHLSSGELPISVVTQRPFVISQWKMELAGRCFDQGNSASGANAILEALEINPALRNPDVMAEAMASWNRDPRVANRNSIIERSLSSLPPTLSWMSHLDYRIERCCRLYDFHLATLQKNRTKVIGAWLTLARHDWRWLSNRGGWSLLIRSAGYQSPRA